MALTATLAFASANHVRYLVASDGDAGGTLTITNAVLQTDIPAGPLRQIARAKDDGIGTIAAGTNLTQAQARALLLSDKSAADVGNNLVPRTILHTAKRSAAAADVSCDANVDGAGKPTIEVQISAVNSIAYLDIIAQGAIGVS